ncbi:MAG: ATP-dependent Clp protease adaptor ClpS [Anaerolineae bacterium]|nr:ATP-dependent Clp protease adaptor ClpS [Anaerolineae bacterium]
MKTFTSLCSPHENGFAPLPPLDFLQLNLAAEPDTGTETETETNTDIDLEFIVMSDEELEQPYRVIIHNDDVTTFEFVIHILVTVFAVTFIRATRIAYEAHSAGSSYVCTLPLDEAKSKVFKAQYAARQEGFPLTFTIEPE